ncbi:MAG TPA: urate hydroxylase PuuD, partial [Rhizomicrobium sp.]|nr:urate hydroxylase PuuD [Rhizomicrobium sp.]
FALHGQAFDAAYTAVFVRYLHVLSGILWIGLLWYFNFVQIPTMPKVPAELKPGVSKYIAPEALFWFRWSALATVVFGLLLAHLNGYITQALSLQPSFRLIGIGMYLGLIMGFNVWFVIWPNQQKALNIAGKYPSLSAEEKAAAGKTAMVFSRINTMLSIPMLFCMVGAMHI